MAPKFALAILRSRILNKRPHEGEENKSPRSGGSGNLKFSTTLEASTPEVQLSKKQKGKKLAVIAKEVIRVDTDDAPTLESRPEDNVLAKDFPLSRIHG